MKFHRLFHNVRSRLFAKSTLHEVSREFCRFLTRDLKHQKTPGRPKCKVVIIYEDSAAGRRAKHFCEEVLRKLVDACDISLDLWNFQVLGLSQVADAALQAAARAASAVELTGQILKCDERCELDDGVLFKMVL